MRRWSLRIALGLLLVYGLFLAVMNGVLATDYFPERIAIEQHNVRIRWESARSWIPGRIHTENLRIVTQDTNVETEFDIEHAEATVGIFDLFDKKATLRDVETDGMRVRVRKTRSIAELCRERPHELPAIGDLARPRGLLDRDRCLAQRDTRMIDTGPTDPDRLWILELDGVRAHNFRELWIEKTRFLGVATATVTMTFHPTIALSVEQGEISIHSGGFMHGRKVLATGLSGRMSSGLPNVSLERDGAERIANGISGDAELYGDFRSFAFLGSILGTGNKLRFGDAPGRLEAHVKTRDGAYLPGTFFKVDSDRLVVHAGKHRVIGPGRLHVTVDDRAIAQLLFALESFKDPRSKISGRDFELRLRSSESTLINLLPHPDLSIRLADLHVPDVSNYNVYIPKSSGFKLVSGDAHASGELVAKYGGEVERGKVSVRTGRVEASYKELSIDATFALEAPIVRADFAKHRYGLDGAKLAIRAGRWWGDIHAPFLSIQKPGELDARVTVNMANLRPVLEVFAVEDHVPGFVKRLVPGRAAGSFELSLSPDTFALDQLDFKAGPLKAEGSIAERGGTANGELRLSYLGIKMALEIEDGETHLALFSSGSGGSDHSDRD